MRIPGALPDVEPERTRVRMSFGAFPIQADHLWQMVRKAEIPPMGGEVRWVVDWDAFNEAFRAEDPSTHGFPRADFFRAMLICRNQENADPALWPEMWVNARAPFVMGEAD